MAIAFFVSSIGDTNLAKATIANMEARGNQETIFLIPLTKTAKTAIADAKKSDHLQIVSLDSEALIGEEDILAKTETTTQNIAKVVAFTEKNKIKKAYIGVPSPANEEIPFQIALALKTIPVVIAYEWMCKAPATHKLWTHREKLTEKNNISFVAPLGAAHKDLIGENKKIPVQTIGHLSLDQQASATSAAAIREARTELGTTEKDALVFISGTSQPPAVDQLFLQALLEELSTQKHPTIQLRFGLHPAQLQPEKVKEYLGALLTTCKKYPPLQTQVKIVVPLRMKAALGDIIGESSQNFVLWSDISGQQAAQSADRVGQAMAGALLNEAALQGKPVYYHDTSCPSYLPESWFAKNIGTFFTAKPEKARSKKDLKLEETAPAMLAKIMVS